jgi:hypothetical protein
MEQNGKYGNFMHLEVERKMMDVWTTKAPDGKTIIFKKEGNKVAGYVYSAEGRTIKEVSSMEEELTREQVEGFFADYLNGVKAATVTVQRECPHCQKKWEAEVAPKKGRLGDYAITCPVCEKPFTGKLPGEIVSEPRAKNP